MNYLVTQIGQVFGLAIVMALQGSLDTSSLETWGWRVPFLLAIITGSMVRAILAYKEYRHISSLA